MPMLHDAWITVGRDALRHNFGAVQALVGPDVTVMAVVKANAFGHGAGDAARVFQEAGAKFFAVTTAEEALELRTAGVTGRILVFLPPLPDQIDALLSAGCDLTAGDRDGVKTAAEAAQRLGLVASVQLKVDTGMGRLGVLPGDALRVAQEITSCPHLRLDRRLHPFCAGAGEKRCGGAAAVCGVSRRADDAASGRR